MKHVLDIGCGNYKDPRATIGIDIDPTTKCDIIMDAQHLKFPNNTFDTAIMRQCLEHIDNPLQALREVHRVLKPKGELELSIPNRLFFKVFLAWWRRGAIYVDDQHLYAWTQPELKNILAKAGFEVVEMWCTELPRYHKPSKLGRYFNERIGKHYLNARAIKQVNNQ